MSRSSLLFTISLILLAVVVVMIAAATVSAEEEAAAIINKANAEGAAGAVLHKHRRRRSIFQACRKDIERICVGGEKKGDERRASLRKAATCLEEHESDIQDEVCKSWLNARKTCFDDVEKSNLCADVTENADVKKALNEAAAKRGKTMMCLRTVEADKLSEPCTSSDFYKAIIGLRRFNRQNRSKDGKSAERREKMKKLKEKMDV